MVSVETDDDDDVLPGDERAAAADDLVAVRAVERVGNRPEPQQHGVLQQDRNADGRDQRQELAAALAQRGEDGRVDQPAQRRPDRSATPMLAR